MKKFNKKDRHMSLCDESGDVEKLWAIQEREGRKTKQYKETKA